MKYIITILLLIITTLTHSQDFKTLIQEYEDYCNQEVQDTVTQTGYSYTKVLDNGEVVVEKTVWDKADCPTYKYNESYFNFTTVAIDYSSHDLYWGNGIKTEKKESVNRFKVTREYICNCKLRKIIPFSEHFWNWIKNYNSGKQ